MYSIYILFVPPLVTHSNRTSIQKIITKDSINFTRFYASLHESIHGIIILHVFLFYNLKHIHIQLTNLILPSHTINVTNPTNS